jgi:hypothetical protein
VERYTNNFIELLNKGPKYTHDNKKEKEEDIKYYQEIVNLLRSGAYKLEHWDLAYEKEPSTTFKICEKVKEKIHETLDGSVSKIIFINTSKLGGNFKPREEVKDNLESRHAELFLTDIAKVIKEQKEQAHICIAGKRRPCLNCYANMRYSKVVDTYVERPGLVWKDGFELLPKQIQLEVLEILDSNELPLYMSVKKKETETEDEKSSRIEKEAKQNLEEYKKKKQEKQGKYLRQEEEKARLEKERKWAERAYYLEDYATGTEDEANNKDVRQEASMETSDTQPILMVDNKRNKKEEESNNPSDSNLPEDDIREGILIDKKTDS